MPVPGDSARASVANDAKEDVIHIEIEGSIVCSVAKREVLRRGVEINVHRSSQVPSNNAYDMRVE
jgi:hypothetical protein